MRLVSLLLAVAACGGSPKTTVHNAPVQVKPRVAVAVVMQGTEWWVGNDSEVAQVAVDDPSRVLGALIYLRAAIGQLELLKEDGQGALITYGDKAAVRVPLGPISRLDAKAFGTQQDYHNATGAELVSGVRAGLAELAKSDATSRVLVVVGDGTATNQDAAKPQLAELAAQAKAAGVTVQAIVYRAKLSPSGSVVGELTTNITTVSSIENIAVALESVVPEDPAKQPARAQGLAVAFVAQGWEAWMGNETEVPDVAADAPDRMIGALVPLRAAVDAAKFETFSPEAKGMVITYADKATVRVPMGALTNLTGKSFGTQADYYGTTGSELVSGVRAALRELRKSNMSRRVLIVFGDGRDTNMDTSRLELAELKKQAAKDGVEVHAVVYKSKLSGEGSVVQLLTGNVVTVPTRASLPGLVKPLFDSLRK